MIDRDSFLARIRSTPIGGAMHQGQADGCNALLDVWETRSDLVDPRWLAYMLAKAKWVMSHAMHPVGEYGRGAGPPYGKPDLDAGKAYYGRGYVQLTWKKNYGPLSAVAGVDLVRDPELALEPRITAVTLFEGMTGGMFAGVGLPRYFNGMIDDPLNARRIVNGTDHADDIATIHAGFLAGLS